MGRAINGKQLPKGIVQRRTGQYQARFTNRFGKRINLYSNDEKEINRMLQDALYEDQHGINTDGTSITLDNWYEIWLEKYKSHVRSTTRKSYISGYKLISSQIGSMKISDVKPIHILDAISHLKAQNYKTGTIKQVKTLAYNIFQKAYENDLVKKNPIAGIVIHGEDDRKRRVLSVKEQELFLSEISISWYNEMFNLLLLTGMRSGECLGLQWDAVDFEKRELYVTRNIVEVPINGKYVYELHEPKTRSGKRMIPLCPEAIYFLKSQREKTKNLKKTNGEFGNLVFVGRSGEMISSSNIRNILRTKIKTINKKYDMYIESISPHVLRHTFATRCYESGIDIKTVSTILGHSRIDITADLYTHALPDTLSKEMEKFQVVSANVRKGD